MRIFFLLVPAWFFISACSADRPDLSKATGALHSGDYPAAIFEARRLLADQPGHTHASVVLARALLMMGESAAAERTLKSINGKESVTPAVAELQAEMLLQLGKHVQLASELSSGSLKPGNDLQALYQGLVEQQNGDCTKALEHFETAIGENRKLTRARVGKAECEAGMRLIGIAIATIKEALNEQPDSAHAYLALSNLLEKVGRHNEANDALNKALQHARGQFSNTEYLAALQLRLDRALNKEDLQSAQDAGKLMSDFAAGAPITQLASVQLMVAQGDTTKAVDTIRSQLKDYQSSPRVQVLLAASLLDSNRLEEGRYLIQRMVTSSPSNQRLTGAASAIDEAIVLARSDPKHWSAIANAQILLGQPLLARKAIEHARPLEQDHRPSDFLLVQLDQALGKLEAALQTTKKLFDAHPGDPGYTAKLAELLGQTGKPQEAISLLENQLGKIQDRNVQRRIHIQLASLYDGVGNAPKAIEHIEKASPSTSAYLLNNLALLYFKNGDSRSLATAREATHKAHDDGEIADTYGWIQFNNGSIKEAVKTLRTAQAANPSDAERSYHLGAALIAAGEAQEGKLMMRNALGISEDFKEVAEARKLAAES